MNTKSQRALTYKEIQASMAEAIEKETGAKVEITMMGENTWSIVGQPAASCAAMEFLGKSNLAKEFGERSLLDGKLFIYFRTGA